MLNNLLSVFILPLYFDCCILNSNRIIPNIYTIKLGINPVETASENISIGFERIKYFTNYCLNKSIFVDNIVDIIKTLDSLDNNIVKLPCETFDIFVGAVLMTKFQSITTEYFEIEYLTIESSMGENIQYNIIDPDDTGLDLHGNHWWNQNNVYTGSKISITWEELQLTESPKFKPFLVKGGLNED